MEMEIHHAPIQCPSCSHVNHKDAIALGALEIGGIGSHLFDDGQRVKVIFICAKCPKTSVLKRIKFGGACFWELPS